MIPVLLTTGVMLFIMAIARWVVDGDAALAQMPGWGTALLIVLGVLMLGLGVLNMLVVRNEQQQQVGANSGPTATR
jgi:hypothetical protein